MYYKQFSEAVEQAIQKLVAPVEKEFNVRARGSTYLLIIRGFLCSSACMGGLAIQQKLPALHGTRAGSCETTDDCLTLANVLV